LKTQSLLQLEEPLPQAFAALSTSLALLTDNQLETDSDRSDVFWLSKAMFEQRFVKCIIMNLRS